MNTVTFDLFVALLKLFAEAEAPFFGPPDPGGGCTWSKHMHQPSRGGCGPAIQISALGVQTVWSNIPALHAPIFIQK